MSAVVDRPGVSVDVRRVTNGDVPGLSRSLSRAFYDDPVTTYLFPNERDRSRRLERYFRFHLKSLFIPRGEAWTTPGLEAASMWMLPGNRQPSVRQALWQTFPILAILGSRIGKAARLVQLLESHHPRSPHYFLGGIGTDPDVQGKGYGSALLNVVLQRCDAERVPSYLENSKERNLSFYESHGYEVIGEIFVPETTDKLWLMWREARAVP
jgi:GNAT superfamily N-acetyltransferase